MQAVVTQYRKKRSTIAVAFSTKDRTDLSRRTVDRLLGEKKVDLHWFDGSATTEGRALPEELMPGSAAATALYRGVVGGPDSAILFALLTLREAGYRWIVLVENDILLDEGWFDAMFAAAAAAERDGFQVGGISCWIYAGRALSFNGDYTLLYDSGAGFIALSHEGAGIVIDNYRTTTSFEIRNHYLNVAGVDIAQWATQLAYASNTNFILGADWMFGVALYMNGLVVAAPPVTVARNIDPGHVLEFIEAVEDHPVAVRGALPNGSRLRRTSRPDVRFQQSLSSNLIIVACHHLRLGESSSDTVAPLTLAGEWKRRWLQLYGPFELFGTGSLTVQLFDAPLSLLVHAREGKAVLEFSNSAGATHVVEVDPLAQALPFTEIPADPFGQRRGAVTVTVRAGAIGLIGLCMQRDLTTFFTNEGPGFDFLAL